MSPILTILACDRAGCQHHSNGDEVSWWAIAEPIEGKLNLVPFEESMKSTLTKYRRSLWHRNRTHRSRSRSASMASAAV